MSEYDDLIASAIELEDQSAEQTSQFNDDPIEKGKTVGRFIGYVELGKAKQNDYEGKKKPDAEMVRITFELLHPTKNIKTYEVDGVSTTSGQLKSLTLSKKLSDKAKFKRLFNKMSYGRDNIKHMAQMLGEAFVLEVFHNEATVDGKKVLYVNLDNGGEYAIGAPYFIDPMTEVKTDYNVPPATQPVRLFLWGNPTKATWDALFIDGTREKKHADGSVTNESKNWLQERILSATNYPGSALHNLLGGVADLPMSDEVAAAAPPADEAPKASEPVKEAEKPNEAAKAPPKATNAADDALAALGLSVAA